MPQAGKMRSSDLLIAALITSSMLASAASAQADDLKIHGTLSITGAEMSNVSISAAAGGEQFAVSSHGKQARLDITGGATTLFDGNTGSVYVLDPGAKTYYKEPLKNWKPAPLPQLASALPTQAPGGGSISDQLSFDETDNTPGNSQVFGGHDSRKYLIDGTVRSERPSRGGGGGFGGGGGYGGGGYGGGGFLTSLTETSGDTNSLLQIVQFPGGGYGRRGGRGGFGHRGGGGRSAHISGDVWLGGGSGFLDGKSNPLWAEALVSAWSVGALTSDLADKIQKSSQVPWQADFKITWSDSSGGNGGFGGDPDDDNGGAAINSNSLDTTATLQSISNVDLPESYFQVPASYTQVSPPAAVNEPSGA